MTRGLAWLRYFRRRWCIWRGHPTYRVVIVSYQAMDTLDPSTGEIVEGELIEECATRCLRHDKERASR